MTKQEQELMEILEAYDLTRSAWSAAALARTSLDDPFKIGPEFAHDEVRLYAVAGLMHAAGDPASKLGDAGVPRWTFGVARLACQALLAAPYTTSNPLHGRFARLQRAFDDLATRATGAARQLCSYYLERIAILHEGTIIVSGTLEELRKLLPPAKVEYVERQPSLEEIFLAIVGSDKKEQR